MIKTNKIAVLGGTGKAGKYITEELLSRGYQLKILARNPDKVTHNSPLIEVVKGSARNYETMQRLLNDCTAIVSALGNSKNEQDTCSTAISHIIGISERIEIKRYIEVAGLVIDTPSDKKGLRTRLIGKVVKAFFPKPAQDRQKGYELLKGSKLDWTIIRCPSIKLSTIYTGIKVNNEDSPGNKVNAADLAGFVVNQLTDEQYVGKCPFVAS